MPRPDGRLFDLAVSISDGTPVDWEKEERELGAELKGLVRTLRVVDEITQAHRELEETLPWEGFESPGVGRSRVWGNLEILEKVGQGSFGEVYRARDPQLDRIVALKLLHLDAKHGTEGSDAMVREGRLLARVHHPNVVMVHGADHRNGRVGIWTEFINGRTLSDLIREQGPFGDREAALIGIDLCHALSAVHSQGVIHRDVKAQNVMREEGGRLLLMDFGIGQDLRFQAEDQPSISGTPLYLAPEILEGRSATARSDLYSLGVLLYHLVTGRFPVEGASLSDLRQAHKLGRYIPLRDVRPGLLDGYVRTVERALSANPEDRFQSAGEMERALTAILGFGEPPRAKEQADLSTQLKRVKPTVFRLERVLLVVMLLAVLLHWLVPEVRSRWLFHRALEAHKNQDIESAIGLLESAVDINPDFTMAYNQKAIYEWGLGQNEKALKSSKKAHELKDELFFPADKHRVTATYYRFRQQIDLMRQELERVVAIEPDDGDSHRNLALINANLRNYDVAIKHARRAYEVEPKSAINHGLIGYLLAEAGHPDDAFGELEEARKNHTGDGYFSWGEGLAWLVKGEVAEARKAFKVMRKGDDSYQSYGNLMLAQTLLYEGRMKEAEHRLLEGESLDSRRGYQENHITRTHWLAQIYYLTGQSEEASKELEELEEDLPDHPNSIKGLRSAAVLYVQLGKFDQARTLLRRLVALRQEYTGLLSRGSEAHVLGELELAAGNLEAAQNNLDEARQNWDDVHTLWSLARLADRQGKYLDAERLLRGILERKGQILEDHFAGFWVLAHLELARCYRKLGKNTEAEASYEAFLSLWGAAAGQVLLIEEAQHELEELVRVGKN